MPSPLCGLASLQRVRVQTDERPWNSNGFRAGLCSTLLPRLVGESRAKALLLSGLPVAADSHLLQGLYFRLFERREDVFPAALKFAKELGKNTSQVAAAFTKAMVNYPGETVEATHVLESKVLLELAHAEDFTELLTSFSQKRAPKMRGTVGKHTTKLYPWVSTVQLGSPSYDAHVFQVGQCKTVTDITEWHNGSHLAVQ